MKKLKCKIKKAAKGIQEIQSNESSLRSGIGTAATTAADTVVPGLGTAMNMADGLLSKTTKNDDGLYKSKGAQAADNILNPITRLTQNAKTVGKVFQGDFKGAVKTFMGDQSDLKNAIALEKQKELLDKTTVAASGVDQTIGMAKTGKRKILQKKVINVEKDELEVDPNMNVVQDFADKPKHPERGMDPRGNTLGTEGNAIIPANKRASFINSPKVKRKQIVKDLPEDTAPKYDGGADKLKPKSKYKSPEDESKEFYSGLEQVRAQAQENLKKLHPGKNVEVKLHQGKRSVAEQQKHHKSGASRTELSLHNVGLAGDFGIYVDGKLTDDTDSYRVLGQSAKSSGKFWGWDWDKGHVGKTNNMANAMRKNPNLANTDVVKNFAKNYEGGKIPEKYKDTFKVIDSLAQQTPNRSYVGGKGNVVRPDKLLTGLDVNQGNKVAVKTPVTTPTTVKPDIKNISISNPSIATNKKIVTPPDSVSGVAKTIPTVDKLEPKPQSIATNTMAKKIPYNAKTKPKVIKDPVAQRVAGEDAIASNTPKLAESKLATGDSESFLSSRGKLNTIGSTSVASELANKKIPFMDRVGAAIGNIDTTKANAKMNSSMEKAPIVQNLINGLAGSVDKTKRRYQRSALESAPDAGLYKSMENEAESNNNINNANDRNLSGGNSALLSSRAKSNYAQKFKQKAQIATQKIADTQRTNSINTQIKNQDRQANTQVDNVADEMDMQNYARKKQMFSTGLTQLQELGSRNILQKNLADTDQQKMDYMKDFYKNYTTDANGKVIYRGGSNADIAKQKYGTKKLKVKKK